MKQLFSLMAFACIFSCCDKDTIEPEKPIVDKFSIHFTNNNTPFSGAIEIFPCGGSSNIYFGNYYKNNLTSINPSYIISKGRLAGTARPVDVPPGEYNMIYWGVNDEKVYSGISRSGPTSIGMNLDTTYWALNANSDSTYKPAYNQFHAIGEVKFPFENTTVELVNVVAGLQITVKNQDGSPFSDNIVGINIFVDNISKRLNYVSGNADFSDGTVTVQFPLIIREDRLEATNDKVLLYPSLDLSKMTVQLKYIDNSTSDYMKILDDKFTANQVQTIVFDISNV